MAYQIRYGKKGSIFVSSRGRISKRTVVLTAVCCVILVLTAFWAMGDNRVWLLPGDSQFTAQALSGFVSSLQSGASFSDALVSFCKQIAVHGYS